ncbi:hypothetical protein LSTR_LSTR015870 [Laodelphax striatellus]|uniref:Receptor ligand binding region domain-containing protein n=1 Tax=Laodelphax striatellus TaxID=195883 RepID=A0A482XKH9_LAOST|nr:hypothetical protein LSTR_LSTR015870 [Laodelphax striatellus]
MGQIWKGAIVYGSDQEVAGLMRAVRRLNATGAFSWIGSDGWSGRSLVTQSNELQVEGTLSLQPQANPVLGFDTYFLNLTVENNKRNPCSWTPYNDKYTRVCTTHERLTRNNTVFENQLQFVSDAVMALAVALQDMHRDLCGGKPGLSDPLVGFMASHRPGLPPHKSRCISCRATASAITASLTNCS